MPVLMCEYCGETTTYTDGSEKPESCPNCYSVFEEVDSIELNSNSSVDSALSDQSLSALAESDDRINSLEEIKLILQSTGEEILIPHRDRIVIGRGNIGAEVLSRIPQISRSHCIIEFIGSEILLSDAGSTNGTFIGNDKIDCAANPKQVIHDGAIIYLGRESFLVQLRFEDHAEPPVIEVSEEPEKFRCKQCGMVFDIRDEICPSCGSFDSMETV